MGAEANHNAKSTLGCDPDYGWSDGAEGSGKCYMLIKNFDYSTCYSDGADGGTLGLSAWWLGGNDMHQEGAWSWPSGQPFGYTNWIEGEPNDSNGLEDCIAIDSPKNYQWMDLNCTDPIHGAV